MDGWTPKKVSFFYGATYQKSQNTVTQMLTMQAYYVAGMNKPKETYSNEGYQEQDLYLDMTAEVRAMSV